MQTYLRKTAIILLAFACLYQAIRQWQTTIDLDSGASALMAWENRFDAVKEIIPINRGIVGYLGEWDVPGIEYEPSDQRAEFLLTQYTLAPLILVRGPNTEWNIAVLSSTAFASWENNHRGEYQIYPLKNNVYVLQKKGDE
jgi:hypothetical protein